MQTLVQVICSKGRSLRDAIVNDRRLDAFGFEVQKKQKPGRAPGWATLHSVGKDRKGFPKRGALKVEWDTQTRVLLCRVINRGKGRPDQIVGDFVYYVLARFRRRIEAINVLPR